MTVQTGYLGSTDHIIPVEGLNRHFVINSVIDCYNGDTLTSSDTIAIAYIKEGWRVDRVYTRVVRIGTLGATILTGIEDSITGSSNWVATDLLVGTTATVNTTVGTLHSDTAGALNGYLFLADGYLIATFSTANFDGILKFAVEVVDLFGYSNDTLV